MNAWMNVRKHLFGRQADYATLDHEQLNEYQIRLQQVIARSERVGLSQHYIAKVARSEAQRIAVLALEQLKADHAQLNVITLSEQVTIASTDVAVDAPHSIRPREGSWCQHVVGTGDILAIEDGQRHALVYNAPAAGRVMSYLGHPILVHGEVVGALCVFDDQERHWTPDDVRKLAQLAEVAGYVGKVDPWNLKIS